MKPITVAKKYARALAEVAGDKQASRLETIAAELSMLARVLASRPEIARFFEDPSVRREDRARAAASLVRKIGAGALTRRFLDVLIENRRVTALPVIAEAFEEIKDLRLGIVPIEATTAVALSAAERRKFQSSLETITGRRVRLTLKVDPEVLGGVRTRIGSRVYDGTLRRQLGLLRERLAEAR